MGADNILSHQAIWILKVPDRRFVLKCPSRTRIPCSQVFTWFSLFPRLTAMCPIVRVSEFTPKARYSPIISAVAAPVSSASCFLSISLLYLVHPTVFSQCYYLATKFSSSDRIPIVFVLLIRNLLRFTLADRNSGLHVSILPVTSVELILFLHTVPQTKPSIHGHKNA